LFFFERLYLPVPPRVNFGPRLGRVANLGAEAGRNLNPRAANRRGPGLATCGHASRQKGKFFSELVQ
jgi:hypothetical protein